MRKLTISFGERHHAQITKVRSLEWADLCRWLTKVPKETKTKEDRGWYCGAEFSPDVESGQPYRHSNNFVARHVLTWDFDHVDVFAWDAMAEAFKNNAYALYTTFSHTDQRPRFRLVLPLSRPTGYDEFQAVSRRLAQQVGLELIARESHVPCQFMFAPCRPVGGASLQDYRVDGAWIDVDRVLSEYADWTDRSSWPRRADGDRPTDLETKVSPLDKPGIVGDFCRAYSIAEAIEKFQLPYVPAGTEGRWTYTLGSRPEGAIEYDSGTKFHSHHDTDPARGQNNAFDLVRLHRFNDRDVAADPGTTVTELPSYKAMVELASNEPEVQRVRAESEFSELGEVPTDVEETTTKPSAVLARSIHDVLKNPTSPRWLIRDELERGVIAVMAGPRGSYKSFKALDWAMRVATDTSLGTGVDAKHPVYVVSAEGGDFDRRARAWIQTFRVDLEAENIPLFVVERRLDLNTKDGIESIRQDCIRLGIRPVLFVLDTFSKLSGGLDENDNTQVKQFIGRVDNGIKRKETGFDATVLIVAHTGHSDASRPRGASALGADTDAEYIVSRDEGTQTVSISRERFKASPELPPLTYKPEVVRLGYMDDAGQEVTSLVLAAAAPARAAKPAAGRPSGANQILTYETAKELTADGDTIDYTYLVEAVRDKLPVEVNSSRDQRRSKIRLAVDALISKELLFLHTGNQLSLHDVELATDEDWLT